MNAETEIKLMRLEVKIDMTLQAYQIQLDQLREELETENDETSKEIIKKWIWMNEKRIDLLNDLKK
jgi:hypothetical protein